MASANALINSSDVKSFNVLTWNIEGLRRNIFNLKHFCTLYNPDLVFLSEPQLFQCDADALMETFRGSYNFDLNSSDKYDPDLPLMKLKAKGGTMILWKLEHDPFITIHPVTTTAFLPIIFTPPGLAQSIHVCVYLPTQGQENSFTEELATLADTLDHLRFTYPEASLYLRGDFNVNDKNLRRKALLESFVSSQKLIILELGHKTYHHFVGNGASDSSLDKILFFNQDGLQEDLLEVGCRNSNTYIDSHHDLLVTAWKSKKIELVDYDVDVDSAPELLNDRFRVVWSDEGIQNYQQNVLPHLERLQNVWLTSRLSKNGMSLLLQATNNLLSTSAKMFNKTTNLSPKDSTRSYSTPNHLRRSSRKLFNKWKYIRHLRTYLDPDNPEILNNLAIFKQERYAHRKAVRHYHAKKTTENLHKLMSNPKNAYNFIKKSRRSKAGKINKLKVGAKTYSGDNVRFGFYESILQFKLKNNSSSFHHLPTFLEDYANIIDLCKAAPELEPISDVEALNILKRMKPDVLDSYNITPNHYLYAGPSGWKHFRLLLNALLSDVENVDIEEVNRAHAIVLFKGKGKDKSSSRSYRTISTCPVVAKALDMIIRDRKLSSWNLDQSPTQFQGHGSSHELAAILLTECIQHSLHTTKRPLFALYLDAKSAFDVVRWELLIKNMYSIHGIDKSLLFIDKRLSCRQTVVEWDGHLLGPIKDEQGLEQGGVSSSDFYKIFGKEQLTLAQESSLGVPLLEQSSSSVVVSAIGQADDTVLLSNDIFSLFYLLKLSSIFCTKYQVELCAEKTRLQRFLPRHWDPLSVQPNPVEINGTKIPFTNTAEHVGILRSSNGNGPSISA